MLKKGSILLLLCMLISATVLSPIPMSIVQANSDSATLYTITSEEAEVYSTENMEKVGVLLKGAQIAATAVEDTLSFHLGSKLVYIQAEHGEASPQPLDSILSEDAENPASLTAIQEVTVTFLNVTDEESADAARFAANTEFSVVSEETDHYVISIGSIAYALDKESVVTETEEAIEPVEPVTVEDSAEAETETENVSKAPENETELAEKPQPPSTPKSKASYQAAAVPIFTEAIKHFKTTADGLTVYDNSTGALVPMGYLVKNQVYERISSFGPSWHMIKFGSKFGFVAVSGTMPAEKAALSNPIKEADTTRFIKMTSEGVVQDNSTGALIPMGKVKAGMTYPIIGVMGSWYKVNFSGRLGFIHEGQATEAFTSNHKIFKSDVNMAVYDNSTGSLVKAGTLLKNQEYYRLGDYGANWHQIRVGNKNYYVAKAGTRPSTGASIRNKNTAATTAVSFEMIADTSVFDNSSGTLVPFGTLSKGTKVNITGTMGTWYKIEFSGRIGYIHESSTKVPFKSTDQYFQVYEDNIMVYDNSSGSLKPVAQLVKGQTYQRLPGSGNWHQIKYGNGYGYVYTQPTKPSTASAAKNFNIANLANGDKDLIAKSNVPVYDNTSGSLVKFAVIQEGGRYPIIDDGGNWWRISIGNRIGYVSKSAVQVGPVFKTTTYPRSLQEMLAMQMKVKPQTDLYKNNKAYVHKDYILASVPQGSTIPATGVVTATTLNVREGAGSNFWEYGVLKIGTAVTILSQQNDWYEIKFGTWRNAKEADVTKYVNPANFSKDSADYFQFLVLSQNAGISAAEINKKILTNKGILNGKGASFVQASLSYNINELYLISHALLETGNGSSALATGVLVSSVDGAAVEPKMVYNMFGIGARDACALQCGSETAYKNGWFSPEAAIVGGAKFISESYVNHPTYKQDTLYKMRWNPENPATHQYATDMGWAVKQVNNIKKLYDLLDTYTLYFDTPVYK